MKPSLQRTMGTQHLLRKFLSYEAHILRPWWTWRKCKSLSEEKSSSAKHASIRSFNDESFIGFASFNICWRLRITLWLKLLQTYSSLSTCSLTTIGPKGWTKFANTVPETPLENWNRLLAAEAKSSYCWKCDSLMPDYIYVAFRLWRVIQGIKRSHTSLETPCCAITEQHPCTDI